MPIKAIYFDLGGVIVRTVDFSSRAGLAAEFGMTYEEMGKFVFGCQTAVQSTVGEISEEAHWLDVIRRLKRPESDLAYVRDAFFGGDTIDWEIVHFLREQRKVRKTGLISNAWDGLRPWIVSQNFEDAFDHMTISAEVHSAKPAPEIYRHALEKLGAQPAEAVFVDDVEKNIAACEALGMKGVLFKTPEQALAEVRNLLQA